MLTAVGTAPTQIKICLQDVKLTDFGANQRDLVGCWQDSLLDDLLLAIVLKLTLLGFAMSLARLSSTLLLLLWAILGVGVLLGATEGAGVAILSRDVVCDVILLTPDGVGDARGVLALTDAACDVISGRDALGRECAGPSASMSLCGFFFAPVSNGVVFSTFSAEIKIESSNF